MKKGNFWLKKGKKVIRDDMYYRWKKIINPVYSPKK